MLEVANLTGNGVLLLQDDLRGHHLPDSGERAYVISKTYILMATTRELARRLEGTGVDVMAGETNVCLSDSHSVPEA